MFENYGEEIISGAIVKVRKAGERTEDGINKASRVLILESLSQHKRYGFHLNCDG